MELSRYAPFVAFWLAVAVICVAGIAHKVLRHRETQKTLRLAIERGEGALATQLAQQIGAKKPTDPAGLVLGGGVQMAAGVGLFLLGMVADLEDDKIIYPLLAIGVMVFLIGAVVLTVGRWLLRKQAAERTPVE